MSRLDQIRRMSDDDLILFLRRYKSEKSSCNRCTKKDTRCNPYTGAKNIAGVFQGNGSRYKKF